MSINFPESTYAMARALNVAFEPVRAGYRAFNGYVFTQNDADLYNGQTDKVLLNIGYPHGLESTLNARHKTFCIITGAQ